jgi:hypothetical protein
MRHLISNSLLPIVALLSVGLGCANTATPSGSGNLRVATTTTGTPLDADGYLLQIDRSSAAPSGQRLGVNANATLADLPAGTHQLTPSSRPVRFDSTLLAGV